MAASGTRRKPAVPSLRLSSGVGSPKKGPSSMPLPQSKSSLAGASGASGHGGVPRPGGGRQLAGANTHSLLATKKGVHAAGGPGHGSTSAATRRKGFFKGASNTRVGQTRSSGVSGVSTTSGSSASRSTATVSVAGVRASGPQRVTPKRQTDDAGISSAPAFKPSRGRYADTINRRGRRGSGELGGSSAGGPVAAALATGGEEGDTDTPVLVKSAAAAEDLMRAEADLSSKLRKAIRGGPGGAGGAAKGTRDPGGRGGEQVARSLAKRRQARLEMARLRSSSAFVDWLWLGNTDRPDVAYKQSLRRRGKPVVRPAGASAPGMAAGALAAAPGAPSPADTKLLPHGSAELVTLPEVDEASPAAAAAAAAPGAGRAAAAAGPAIDTKLGPADVDDPTPTGRSAVPKQWTGAGTADGVVRPMRPRRGSMGATAVDKILSDFDKEKTGAGGKASAAGGRRGRRMRNAKGVRGGGEVKRIGIGAGASGSAKAAADESAKPKNEQAPEKGNVHARIAAKRRHLPDGGCARCWAISTRCCAEALELRRARAEAARQGVVLTGRAQEAVDVLGITQGQVRKLYRQFVELDDGLEGRIHLSDFFEEFLGMPRSAVTDAIWLALVENTTGQMLGFEDFVMIVCVYCMFTEEDILRFCFSTFDINGNGDLDEDEFLQMLRIVNHEKPLFPGNFRQALDMFDTDANGVITFDEFVAMHQKFPLLLWPLFQLQDRMQSRSLGRAAWTAIGRRDAKMRQVNQTMLRSKDAALAAAPGLARGDAADPAAATGAAQASGAGAASATDGAISAEHSLGAAVSPTSVTASGTSAPGQRLAGGDMSGLAMKAMAPSKSGGKGKGGRAKSGGKSSSSGGRRR